MDLSTSISITVAGVMVTIWLIWRKRRMGLFQRLGIPGPKPSFWTGNLTEIIEKGSKCEVEWVQKYGKMVGYYFGAKPILIVADPELLKTVLVKEFNDFTNKDMFIPNGGIPVNEMKHAIGIQKDEKWKLMRSIITPSFSIGKLRNMTPIINESIDTFMKKIEENAKLSEPFDIYPLYRKLVLDIVTRTSFGISTNIQNEENSFFLECVMRVLNNGASDVLNFVSLCFPEVEPIPTWLKVLKDKIRAMFGLPSVKKLLDICEDVIQRRKASPETQRPDLMQNLIDASISKEEFSSKSLDDLAVDVNNREKSTSKSFSPSKKGSLRMTNEEIKANAMVFIIAGYDTTSVSLAFVTHFLVHHQAIQDKVRSEIMAMGENINYQDLSNLPYLDQVYSETLRLFPPLTSFTVRVSSKLFKFNGITIPRGMIIQAPLWHLHRNPDYWTEPEVFRPERFSIQNKSTINSMIYQPFGIGPRNCIGVQMAKMVAKLTLSHLLNFFYFVPAENTEAELEIDPKFFVNYPKKGVKVQAVPLSQS